MNRDRATYFLRPAKEERGLKTSSIRGHLKSLTDNRDDFVPGRVIRWAFKDLNINNSTPSDGALGRYNFRTRLLLVLPTKLETSHH